MFTIDIRKIVFDSLTDPESVIPKVNRELKSAADVADYILEYVLAVDLDDATDAERDAIERDITRYVEKFRATKT